ncbi:actin-binding WH2 domain-containing protein [bacterium]|nr:actin-binding WH2 domain-containing protein [bacterium]
MSKATMQPDARKEPSLQKGEPGDRFQYSQEDFQFLRKAIRDSSLLQLSLHFLDYILRAQTVLFEQIYSQQKLPRIIFSMAILCAFLSAIYGATMGMNHSLVMTVTSAIKLPILFLMTAIICIPSLYTFNVLLGQQFRFLQVVSLMTMTLGTTTILLASLSPLSFFFVLTTNNYSFLLLMHVAILGLCGAYGVQYLYRGCSYIAFRMEQSLNTLLLQVWIGIYAVVGMQLGWRLRPFVGFDSSPFQLFRAEEDGNFYIAVWESLVSLFAGNYN